MALAPDAWANWEYTRWGMTLEQVVAASKGAVKALPANARPTAAGLRAAATGTHKDGNLMLEVRFSFDEKTNGLACVAYVVRNSAQNALLKDTLMKRYGRPQNEGGLPAIGLEEITWTRPMDQITLMITQGERANVLHCNE
jgi:hypothetical protein